MACRYQLLTIRHNSFSISSTYSIVIVFVVLHARLILSPLNERLIRRPSLRPSCLVNVPCLSLVLNSSARIPKRIQEFSLLSYFRGLSLMLINDGTFPPPLTRECHFLQF